MIRVGCALLVLIVAAVTAWIWFTPSGTGEYADSPNGRYRAWASNLGRGTFFHGEADYIEIEVVETATGRVVWKAQRFPLAGEAPPDYGDRSKSHIVWAPDSRSVSIPVGAAADAVFTVR